MAKKIEEKVKTTTLVCDTLSREFYQLQAMYEKAQEVSEYYGFLPVYTPIIEPAEMLFKKGRLGAELKNSKLTSANKEEYVIREEFALSLLRCYRDNKLHEINDPALLYSCGNTIVDMKENKDFELAIIGTPKAIADAIIIRTTFDIIEEYGFEDAYVDINSVGDADTRAAHAKELANYYKKNTPKLCAKCVKNIKKLDLTDLKCDEEACGAIIDTAPTTLNFLNTESRKHFKEILQYLEEMAIPYRINPKIKNTKDYGYRTTFAICAEREVGESVKQLLLARGGRYEVSKYINFKKELMGINSTITLNSDDLLQNAIKMSPKIHKPAKFYFIQIGFEAKLKSLNVMEILRKSNISVMQNLSKDSLTEQLALATEKEVPYAIILGQKEAMNNTVIVRDMKKHSQDTIKISELCNYIKKTVK